MLKKLFFTLSLGLMNSGIALADEPGAIETRQFTYAWPYSRASDMAPRGGSSTGADVTLIKEASPAWKALNEAGIDKKERDRRAILAMAGPYRASFDFIETVGFTPGYTPPRPYQSWGTEYVYVITDEPDFISLQHIMVMTFVDADGVESEPVVVKHWRQDWRYEDTQLNVYIGKGIWERQDLSELEVSGTWSQAVFQVDDSPRYESIGTWEHRDNYSSWESGITWRPLPRREFSVRDDYDALAGTNRHTITPTGWVHEEDNLKLVLAGPGQMASEQTYLAREAGFNRYERIRDHDFSAGDTYWDISKAFWHDVRSAWEKKLGASRRLSLAAEVDGKRLFAEMFRYADGLSTTKPYNSGDGQDFIEDTLGRFVQELEHPSASE